MVVGIGYISRGLSCSLCPNTALDLVLRSWVTMLLHVRRAEMWSHDTIDFEMSLLISVTRPILVFTLKLVATWFVIGLLADLLPLISLCHPPSLLLHLIKHASHQALQLYEPKPASTRLMIPNAVS